MKYPDEFAAKVRAEFPGSSIAERFLRNGNEALQRLLDESQTSFSASKIVKAFEDGKLDDLLAQAKRSQRIEALHYDWCKLYQAEQKSTERVVR